MMSQHAGVFRTTAGLETVHSDILKVQDEMAKASRTRFSQYAFEAENIATLAELVTRAALERKENVGLHYNEDLVK